MINVRFDLIESLANPNRNHTILQKVLPTVPDTGEIINISGDPYLVYHRGWAVDETSDLFCYIELLRAFPENNGRSRK